MKLTRRAALRATEDVGRKGRTVNEVADELGCDWHTINDTVVAYGEVLVDHPDRFAEVHALGLDETAFVRAAPYYRTNFVTSIVDVERGQLLDVVPGRGGDQPKYWLWSRDGSGGMPSPTPPWTCPAPTRRSSTPACPCHPGGRQVPRHQAGQRTGGRDPASSPERGARAPWPQG